MLIHSALMFSRWKINMQKKECFASLGYVSVTYVTTRTNELLERQAQNELNLEAGSEEIIRLHVLTTRVRTALPVTEEIQSACHH